MRFVRGCWLAIGLAATNTLAPAADSSPQYDGVLTALQEGKAVYVLSDLSRCASSSDGKPGPAVQSGTRINSFIVIEPLGIAFSDVHEALDRLGRPVTEYIRYNIGADGKVIIRVAHLSASSPEAVDQGEYVCQSPDGAKFVW